MALAENPVAYSSWDGPGGRYALYQFVPGAWELPGELEGRIHTIDALTGQEETCHVQIWCEAGRGYALVCPPGNEIPVWPPRAGE